MDELAGEYLRLALSVGRLEDGVVDSYYGPAEVRAEVERRAASAAELVEDAALLRERVSVEPDRQRALWLDRQLLALETLARRLAGEEMPYIEEVARCFDAAPAPTAPETYAEAHAQLERLLPAGGDLRARADQRRERLTVPPERLAEVVEWLLVELRRDCAEHFPLPDGERLSVSMVSGQPWSAYNWYDGNLRSRIEINTDLPTRAPELISLLTHETFPGHHLEHAWKEARLYREQGRAEASIQLINTPEAYISEGLAEVGRRYVVDRERWQELFSEICRRARISLGTSSPEREWEIERALHMLRGAAADAALMLHVEGRPPAEVLRFLEEQGLRSPAAAEKSLAFISHPLWRTYIFCYSGGERLLERWCQGAGTITEQRRRFLRLLTEQLTPSAVAAELRESAQFGQSP